MVAGGIAVWNALDDDQPTEVIVVDQSPTTPEPVPTTAPIERPPDEPAAAIPGAPADSTEPGTPESLSTGPVLEWTEFDPASVFGADVFYVGRVETVGDGRVLVQVASPEGNQVMVSENGADWTVIAMPPDFSLEHFDIASDRWLVAGMGRNRDGRIHRPSPVLRRPGHHLDRPEHPARSRRWETRQHRWLRRLWRARTWWWRSLAARTPTLLR